MTCTMPSPKHKELVMLKAAVVNTIRKKMSDHGAIESYYNKITGGTGACFLPGTKITVDDGGFKLIEDIQEGDLVLTHKGRLRKVNRVMKRNVEEEIYQIKVTGVPDVLKVTEEHPLYIREMLPKKNPHSHDRIEYESQPKWLKPSEIKNNDVIHAPTYNPGNTTEEIDEETAFMLGIFCAEGFLSGVESPQKEWRGGQYYGVIPNGSLNKKPNNGFQVHFVLHATKDVNLIAAIKKYANRLNIAPKFRKCASSDKTVNVALNYRPFAKFCKKHVGKGARTKRLSSDLMRSTVPIQKAFLAGYLFGDGYINNQEMKNGKIYKRIISSTASEQLAHQLFWMMERCGIISTTRHTKVCGGPQYRERVFDQWKTIISQTQAKKLSSWLNEDFVGKDVRGGRFASAACTYSKISGIKKNHYKGAVYNFAVDEDNTYVANGCTVHNCESVDTAFILQNTPELSFLSQTDQLLMEAEILEYDIDAIWTLGRSYRNEPRAGDGRHLAEFALLEFEARDMDLAELVQFQQKLLCATITTALESNVIDKDHRERLKKYLKTPATIISYTDILKRLNDGGVSINWGDDFSSEIEEMVCLLFDGPVQVTNYPESIKFFNMYRAERAELESNLSLTEYNKRRYTVDCVDFLLPFGGESFGGSRREEDYSTIKTKLRESLMFKRMAQIRSKRSGCSDDMPIPEKILEAAWKPFVSYLELFNLELHPDRVNVIRSGFGLGMGRLIQFLLGKHTISVF